MVVYGKIDEVDKKLLVGLWLDDNRHDPIGFLNDNKPSDSGKVVQKWYKDNMSNSDIQWTSVSNFDDFKGYVERNGVPDFVSLDHDLKKDKANIKNINGLEYLYSGADCALWLVSYCLRKGLPIPRNYIHSANDNKRVFISKAFRLGNMGKDPLEGVDIDNQQEFIAAADRFRRNITNPNISKNVMKVKDNAQLGSADRLARMRGVKNTNDLFGKSRKEVTKFKILFQKY